MCYVYLRYKYLLIYMYYKYLCYVCFVCLYVFIKVLYYWNVNEMFLIVLYGYSLLLIVFGLKYFEFFRECYF